MAKQSSRTPFIEHRDHYQEVTDRIVAALEAGTKPWQQPWMAGTAAGPLAPVNPTTGRRYHGINTLVLAMTSFALGGDPRFCSYKQAADRGWQVRRGERGTTVFFFKRMEVEDRDAPPKAEERWKRIPLLRAYTVFHGSQLEGIPPYAAPTPAEAPWRRPEAADVILRNSGAVIRTGGDRAFYSIATDTIHLPSEGGFRSPQQWASVALHEAAHWTGAPQRLNRALRNRFGTERYAQEELRAELASAFLGAELGLPCDLPGHASYIASWLGALRQDRREIFRAAADAQRIADYLLAFHPDHAARLGADAVGNAGEMSGQEDANEREAA